MSDISKSCGLEERVAGAEPLLVPVMRGGQRIFAEAGESGADLPSVVAEAQQRFLAARKRLPEPLRALRQTDEPYPVRYAARLEELSEEIREALVRPMSA